MMTSSLIHVVADVRISRLALSPKLESSGMILSHCNLRLLGSNDSLALTSQIEMEFHHVSQAGLKLLISGESHCAWPVVQIKSDVSLWIFCLDDLSNAESGVLKSPAIIILGFISPFSASNSIQDIGMGKDFMMKLLEATATKAKIDTWDLIKEFLYNQRNCQQSKQTIYRREKIFANCLSDNEREGRMQCSGMITAHCNLELLGSKTGSDSVTQAGVQWLDHKSLDLRKFKDAKKQFEKVSEEKENALVKNAQVQRNKQHEVEEATNILTATRKCFRHIALDYVLQDLSDSRASASRIAGITGTRHHTQLLFILLVEMGFYHVGQTGLKLLTSSDLPASASQSVRMSHRARPETSLIVKRSLALVDRLECSVTVGLEMQETFITD
ncbi:Arf-GAP with coiled-coil, ANK repeat and PH domain-containing protein 2 [Plecturocebus cupreus]